MRWSAFFSSGLATSVAMETWPVEHRVFVYDGHLISHFGDVLWPPRSPDLSMCDFSLWGFLKSRVYTHKPHMLNDLKEAICQEILPIVRQLAAHVMDDLKKNLENCIQEDGRHLTNIIFKT
jgi:hypothetical protein